MSSTASATLATWFKIKGVNYSISSACATSNHCIGNGTELIQWGKQTWRLPAEEACVRGFKRLGLKHPLKSLPRFALGREEHFLKPPCVSASLRLCLLALILGHP